MNGRLFRSLGRALRRCVLLAAGLAGVASIAPAYYQWTFYTARTGPFTAIPVKFDLKQLPDSTVSYFLPRVGPAKMVEGDTYAALIGQIRRAAEAWNTPESALGIRFGGFSDTKFDDAVKDQLTPAIDVVFDEELPPGVLAYTEPWFNRDLKYLSAPVPEGQVAPTFVPILRSRLRLAADLTARNQASYAEAFFGTLVHEFGHTLGLQHSMTSGVMATAVTRNISLASPLTADDIAGLAHLYPTADFTRATGAIAGHVSAAGADANLASVVALRVSVSTVQSEGGSQQVLNFDGTAVGAMTQPDGKFKIDGLAPGEYVIYAHPIPAALPGEQDPAGIVPPRDLDFGNFAASSGFETRFYPNTRNWREAARIQVRAGAVTEKVDFALAALTGTAIRRLDYYNFLDNGRRTQDGQVLYNAVRSGPVVNSYRNWAVFYSPSALLAENAIVPGLKLEAVGSAALFEEGTLRNYWNSPEFLAVVLRVGEVAVPTPVTAVLSSNDDLLVLPRAFSVQPMAHPAVSSVEKRSEEGRTVAVISGGNLTAATRVFFDGSMARGVVLNEDGTLSAEPPAAFSDHAAVVTVSSAGGQTSQQVRPGDEALPRFIYDPKSTPWYSLSPGYVMAGTDVMLSVQAGEVDFLSGKTAVGFGTSDVVVRQMWVTRSNQLLLNVSVRPGAKLGLAPLTISTGLQVVTDGIPLQIRPRPEGQRSLLAPIVSAASGLPGAPAGSEILLRVSEVPSDTNGWVARIGGVWTGVTKGSDGQLRAQLPLGIPVGPQVLEVIPPSGEPLPPVLVQVDPGSPEIVSIEGPAVVEGASPKPLAFGDIVTLRLRGMTDGVIPQPGDVDVRVGAVPQAVDSLEQVEQAAGVAPHVVLRFRISPLTAYGKDQPVTVRLGTRISNAVTLTLDPPEPPTLAPAQ